MQITGIVRMKRACSLLVIAAALLVQSWGCGGSDGKPPEGLTVPVKGQVTYKGKPLTGGSIMFEPVDGGREAHGTIQPDGTFSLSTFRSGDGAVRGVHRVA